MHEFVPASTVDVRGRELTLYGKTLAEFDGTTTNKRDYVAHPLEPRPPPPPHRHAGQLAFEGESTYHAEFHAHPLPERPNYITNTYHPSPGEFDGTTTYGSTYVPHTLERPTRHLPPQERVSLPFDGTTTSRTDFVAHQLPERPQAYGGTWSPSKVPFEGASTYKDTFVPHAIEARPPPQTMGVRESLPFDGSTTYGEYFRPYPVQAPPSLPQNTYRPNPAKFEGTTENSEKYRAWAIDPSSRQPGGPPPMRPSLPFDGTTTNREMFKGWQLPPRRPALGVQMVGDVTYQLIPANADIPALGRQVFTTVENNQREMRIMVLEGDFSQASRCNLLGHFDLVGLAPGPKGAAKVEVTFHVDANGVLNVSACDLSTQRQEQWLRDGYMEAHVNHAN